MSAVIGKGRIISIRGPSGAGKSTVVKRVMGASGPSQELFADDARLPIGLLYAERRLIVLGRYDVMASGADAVPIRNWDRDRIFNQLRSWAQDGYRVVFEGMAVSNETQRTSKLPAVVVIGLTTSLEDCVRDSIRRREGSAVKNLDNTSAIRQRIRELDMAYLQLRRLGVTIERLDREQAYERVMELT